MKKIAAIPLMLFLALSAFGQPLRVLLWDNDNGATLYDPDEQFATPIGCESKILQSLEELGYSVALVPFFTGPGDADVIFITNGWRNDSLGQSPGIIEPAQRQMLVDFMDTGHPVFMDGCDIAYTYGIDGTLNFDTLFLRRFAAKFVMDDSPWPMDSILGISGTPFTNCNYSYDPLGVQNMGPQSSVDIIDTVFRPNGEAWQVFAVDTTVKWAYCRGICYSAFWKNQTYNAVLLSFIFSALRDTSDEETNSTKTKLMRLAMWFFNQNSAYPFYPSPPDTVWASAVKGSVQVGWNMHVDDKVIGYKLVRLLDSVPDAQFMIEDRLQTSFLDTSAVSGVTYTYALSALAQLTDTGNVLEGRCATSGAVIPTGITSPYPFAPPPLIHDAFISNGNLHLTLGANTLFYVSVYDVSGRLVNKWSAFGAKGLNKYKLGSMPSGLYLIRLNSGYQTMSLRAVMLH